MLVGEAGASSIRNQPQRGLFGAGGSAAVTGYRSVGMRLLVGLRLRAGMFTNGDMPDATRADPGLGGLGALAFAVRLRPFAVSEEVSRAFGLWVEAAGGGGVTGRLMRPMVEVGGGVGFAVGQAAVGPFFRYLQVVQQGADLTGADAKIVIVGLELALPVTRSPPQPEPPARVFFRTESSSSVPASPTDRDGDGLLDPVDRCPDKAEDPDHFEDQDGCPDEDNDKDGVADARDVCPDQVEVVNGVDDEDGCPDTGLIELIADRVVLEDGVLFETERARVSTSGQRVLAAVVELWRQHPEWERMEVEGHADARGPERFNQWLSEERAQRVRSTLVRLGVLEAKVSARGFGTTRPRAQGKGEPALWRNRRVELVVVRKTSAPAGTAEAPEPPDVVQPPPVEVVPSATEKPAGGQ